MAKAAPKTTRTKASVAGFLSTVADDTRRADAKAVAKRAPPLVKCRRCGRVHRRLRRLRKPHRNLARIGFSPRKANLVLYIMTGFKQREALPKKLGKHITGKVCLYINRLADVDVSVLRVLIEKSYAAMNAKYG